MYFNVEHYTTMSRLRHFGMVMVSSYLAPSSNLFSKIKKYLIKLKKAMSVDVWGVCVWEGERGTDTERDRDRGRESETKTDRHELRSLNEHETCNILDLPKPAAPHPNVSTCTGNILKTYTHSLNVSTCTGTCNTLRSYLQVAEGFDGHLANMHGSTKQLTIMTPGGQRAPVTRTLHMLLHTEKE